jgi:hypothetical protein
MPVGLVVMKWDERIGTQILAKYPEEVVITEKTLMQVYSTHEYTGEPGMVSMMVGPINIASYYTGPDIGIYLLLLLSLEDNPDAYEGGLVDVSRQILANLEDNAFKSLIPSLFQRLSVYPTLSEEQSLAFTYQDEIKKIILNRLREEGVISKSELIVWLKDVYKHGFIDIDAISSELIKKELIKQSTVKGMPSELLFLTKDLFISRIPPTKLYRNPIGCGLPKALSEDYKIEVKSFFEDYTPNKDDNLKLIDLIIDPQVYETLKLLREAIVTRDDLEKLKKKGVEDTDEVLKKLWGLRMIQVLQDETGNEYYGLVTDFIIKSAFPKYQLSVIKEEYEKKSKSNKVLVEYLNILKDSFLETTKKKKPAKKEKKKKKEKVKEAKAVAEA